MNKSLKKNYIYNLIYQVIVIILPIVTTPYISRVLGAKNIGIYGYTLSISSYFVLFGSLGVSIYGQREIAYLHKSKEKYSKTFFEIFFMKCITMLLSIIIFYIFFIFKSNKYSIFYMILILDLISNLLDISWFFQGLEEFKKIVLRNLVIKLISLISIFVFVKTKNDLIIYFLIYVLSNIIGNLSLWLSIPKYVQRISIKKMDIFKHFKPTIIMFVPQIAIQIYTVLDRTMIGKIITDKSEVGFYTQGEKIIKLLLTIVSSLGIVMLPRIAKKFAEKDNETIKKYLYKSFNVTFLLSFPLIFGLVLISDSFVPIFFGSGYDKVSIIMKIICPIILFIGVSGIIGYQYFLPTKHQKEYTISVIIGAISNFCINILLIPKYGSIGAAFGTVIAEFIVAMVQIMITKNFFDYKYVLKSNIKYLIVSVLMFIICYTINMIFNLKGSIHIIIDVIIGGGFYFFALFIIHDELLCNTLDRLKLLGGKIHERKNKKST